MLETLWYGILLILQALQTNPQLHGKTVTMDVYVGSSLAYNLQFKGSFTDGVITDSQSRRPFGDFELVRRDGKRFIVSPAQTLPEQLSGPAKPKAVMSPDSPKQSAGPSAPANRRPQPFILDFTDSLRILASMNQKPVIELPFSAAADYLNPATNGPIAVTGPAPTAASSPKPVAPTPVATSPDLSKKAKPDSDAAVFRWYRYPSHWVLSATFADLLVVVTVQ